MGKQQHAPYWLGNSKQREAVVGQSCQVPDDGVEALPEVEGQRSDSTRVVSHSNATESKVIAIDTSFGKRSLMMKVKTKAIMKIIFAIFRIFSQIHRQAE